MILLSPLFFVLYDSDYDRHCDSAYARDMIMILIMVVSNIMFIWPDVYFTMVLVTIA